MAYYVFKTYILYYFLNDKSMIIIFSKMLNFNFTDSQVFNFLNKKFQNEIINYKFINLIKKVKNINSNSLKRTFYNLTNDS